MPGSSPHGKPWIKERLENERPQHVLDIGAGCGTYSQMFRALWEGARWTAVEVWAPYIEQYKLREQYDEVHVTDARLWTPDRHYDVAFLGDVLEHMTRGEACALLDRMRSAADVVVISLPIVHYPQGALFGNPFEVHVEEDWSHDEVVAVLGEPTEYTNDQEIGAYIYRQRKDANGVRVAVYAIAKNEAGHVTRWAESARDADHLIVCDTGSTDGTPELLRALGVTVYEIRVMPWRFDVARNASLALIPGDVDFCIALDMDEVLLPGWKAALVEAKRRGLTRPRYRYVWSWGAEGVPDLIYHGDKVHARSGYRWRHPVHETLNLPPGMKEVAGRAALEIHHHPDPARPQPDYFPLLHQSVKEDPADDRNAHYFARELYFQKRFAAAAVAFRRHLALPASRWHAERSASMRYLAKCEPGRKVDWLLRASLEAPGLREPWVDLAVAYREQGKWGPCYAAAMTALAITERELLYLTEGYAWGASPHDEAAQAAYYLGMYDEALRHGARALELDPISERMRSNMAFYQAKGGHAVSAPEKKPVPAAE